MTSKQPSDPNKKLIRADPTTIRGKFLVGYRGWFTCPGDGAPLVHGDDWAHWTDERGQFNAQLLPDPEYYSAGDLVVAPQTRQQLFSSRNVSVIRRHLNIMAMHGIDGLFITRRGGEIAAAYQPGGNGIGIMKLRSEGINNVFRAAEQEGRVVGIMYDLAGMPSHQIEQWIAGDWDFMINQKHVLDSPVYVREHGVPVVAIWGVGFKHAGQDPEMVMRLISRIREASGGAYIILGVPITWQKQDSNWQTVYHTADALAPMCIGTIVDEEGANNWSNDVQQPAIQSFKAAQKRTDFVSVVWPGNEGQLVNNMGMNTGPAPRRDGAFLWRQVYNAHRDGARLIYAEMFDGFDDGTAILPSLGAQNSSTPSDWYLRICGYASEALKGEKRLYEELPRKELAEYWSMRPRYEERQQDESSGPSGSGAQANAPGPSLAVPARAPTRSMTADISDAPPPYSLEAAAPASSTSAGAVYTAEPESVPPANPSFTPQTSYHNAPVGAPSADRPRPPRVDSSHSTTSVSSYPGQHRPEPIAVPGHGQIGVPVQTPGAYHAPSPGQVPSGYPGVSPGASPMMGAGSGSPLPSAGPGSPPMSGAPLPMHTRPPQHPTVAGRPPTNAPRPPSRPGRPPSAASGSSNPHSAHPSPPPTFYDPSRPGGGMHQLTNQMQGMNVGDQGNRPAPEHFFAGVNIPNQPRPQMPGTPASPFEGVNMPGRYGQQQEQGPSLFGQPPRHQNTYGQGHDVPPTPPSAGIPGSPLYPAPLQQGHGPTPVHQSTIGPAPHPVHQHSLGPTPVHQGSVGPGHPHPAPTHQATLGPSPQPGQPSSPHQQPPPGQPPQPSFQQNQPYVPHHQSTGHYTPPQGPPPQGPPPHSGGYFSPGTQPPQPGVGTYSPHAGPQPQHGGWPPAGSPGGPFNHPQAGGGYTPPAAGSSQYPPQPGPGGPQAPYGGQGAQGQLPPPTHPQRPAIPGSQYIDTALGAVGKYAGEDKKKKLEQGLASTINAGTKLWGRFNK